MVSRRKLLAGVSSLMTVSLSGCVSAALPSEGSVLNCIEIVSASGAPHTVHLRVDYEDDEVLSDTYRTERRNQGDDLHHQWVPQQWPDEPGHFRVHTRMDHQTEWVTIDSREESDGSAYHIAYWIGADGNGIPDWETSDLDDRAQQCNSSLHDVSTVSG